MQTATIEKTYRFRPSGRDYADERALTVEQRAAAMLARMKGCRTGMDFLTRGVW
jgi:hypothetical protein